MKYLAVVLVAVALSACGTVKGTASGFVDGLGKDVQTVGSGLSRAADKIKSN